MKGAIHLVLVGLTLEAAIGVNAYWMLNTTPHTLMAGLGGGLAVLTVALIKSL
jgi:hypothetical protein